jgi:hypothetical protein
MTGVRIAFAGTSVPALARSVGTEVWRTVGRAPNQL